MPLVSGNQLRAARVLLGLEQKDLARLSGVALNTVSRLEGLGGASVSGARAGTIEKLERALAAAGVELTNGDQPGVRLSSRDK